MLEMREDLSQSDDRIRLQINSCCDDQESLWLTTRVKGVTRSRQMRSMKANESEPLMKGRKTLQMVSKPGLRSGSGSSAGEALFTTGMTPGLKAARAWIRLRHGTLEPVAPMPRERPKRGNRKAESTEVRALRSSAGHRDGTARSSDEGRVTRLEPRGRVIQFLVNRSIPMDIGRGAHG